MSNPVLGVWPLTSSLAGQDRSGIASLTGVGPIRYDAGLWLEEAGTNRFVNSQFWSNLLGVAFSAKGTGISATLAWDAARKARWTVSSVDRSGGAHMYWGYQVGGSLYAPGDTITISAKVTGSGTYAASAYVAILPCDGGGVAVGTRQNGTSVVIDGSEDIVTVTMVSLPVGATDFYAYGWVDFGANGGSGTVDWDDVQIESNGYRTSLIPQLDGSGVPTSGYAYVGTAHQSFSTRAASSASISPAGILTPSAGALAFRVTPTIETGLEELWGECGTKGSGTDHLRWGRDSSTHPYVEWSSNDAAYQRLTGTETLAAGVECLFYTDWDGTIIRLSIDNGTIQTDTRDAVSDSWGAGDLVLKAE